MMRFVSKNSRVLYLLGALALPVSGSLAAQSQDPAQERITVNGLREPVAAEMTEGPEVDGIITARRGDELQVTTADGTSTTIAVRIRFLPPARWAMNPAASEMGTTVRIELKNFSSSSHGDEGSHNAGPRSTQA